MVTVNDVCATQVTENNHDKTIIKCLFFICFSQLVNSGSL